MPYFSFSLKQNFFNIKYQHFINSLDLKTNITYYSKNTKLWKILNKKSFNEKINYARFEKREKIKKLGPNILFCLPPSIGFGDAIEYGLAINAIINSYKFHKVAIAFVGPYEYLFLNYFNIVNIYKETIPENCMKNYDTLFHLTLEIEKLKFQKYVRHDIEEMITDYFKVKKIRKNFFKKNQKIKKVTIFPISKSPIRSMSVNILQDLVGHFSKIFKVEVVFDSSSNISNFIEKNISTTGYLKKNPKTINELCNLIENIEYGIFMDSGPLHLAKILQKKGSLITTSVSKNILLNSFNSIDGITNSFKSDYCSSPCGLTNLINNKNVIGCYEIFTNNKRRFTRKKQILILYKEGR